MGNLFYSNVCAQFFIFLSLATRPFNFRYMRNLLCLLCFVILLASCSQQNNTLFKKIDGSSSGITFNNVVTENDSINPIDLEFLYNGCGVATGDFNNDGLQDLYFTASMGSNKLYINKGNLEFEDVTGKSNVTGEGMWSSSATVIDVNNDGLDDIYVCTSIKNDAAHRRNLLYINEGVKQGQNYPSFKESAAEYGLADTSFSVVAAFADLDNDGDLDMFLVTTRLAKRDGATFTKLHNADRTDMDKLFINEWSDSLKHPVFKDVSMQAGINFNGYGLGVVIADINRDGWKDIYVTNDFYGSDNLFINNKNGTFTEDIRSYIKHTSQNAMGVDINDINNDGLADILSVDMNPEDNYRKKKNLNGNNYYVYQSMLHENLVIQYVRNTLLLNMGPSVKSNDSVSHPVFSDISFFTGVAETDWSWNPTMADFNNDGNRDIIITNGYPRDVTDHDFAAFRAQAQKLVAKKDLIDQIPAIKVPNYAFSNNGNLQFEDVSEKWGFRQSSFSNGAIAVDLDNDGDLDYVISNINDEASLYENTLNTNKKTNKNYISIAFKGDKMNKKGIGAFATVYCKNTMQVYENQPTRGYLSCVDTKAYFGLDTSAIIDSIIIRWPGNKKQVLTNVKANQLLTVDITSAATPYSWDTPAIDTTAMFTDITAAAGINYQHQENDFTDFDKQRLLPHKFSQYGPSLAIADVDGNGLDDIYIGGSAQQAGSFLLQQPGGTFTVRQLPVNAAYNGQRGENMGVLLFDADNDGDNDLWCANGSNEFTANTPGYADKFYINDGKGNFRLDTAVMPVNYTSKSCIRAADYDNDGDLDLFIGGRCLPGSYPTPVSSFIYRNDSKNGVIKFTDVTAEICKDLQHIGMVCDAVWTDFDNDNKPDLVIAGEWMPLTFLKNVNGHFENVTAATGIAGETGWWGSIIAGDFDNDGDIDYVAGNLGKNAFLRANQEYPVKVYGKDFDNNGTMETIVTTFLKDQQGLKLEYPAMSRDDIVSQLPLLKKKYLAYKSFAVATVHDIFTDEQLKDAVKLQATNFSSCYIQNNGNGKFEIKPLPSMAQLAPLNGMVADDFNNDGNLDVAVCGNDYGNEVSAGRYDAMNGLIMLGDGKGGFIAQTIQQAGFFVPGDAKALTRLKGANDKYLLAASQNKGPLKLFRMRSPAKLISTKPGDMYALIQLKNGKTRKQELYSGSGLLSQSAALIVKNSRVASITIVNKKLEERKAD